MLPDALLDTATLEAGTKFVLAAALGYGCISDIRRLRLPDSVWLVTLATFFFHYWLQGAQESLAPHLWAGGIVFALTYAICLWGVLGGGDVKLISALVFWGGSRDGLVFLTVMALIGGLIALALLILRASMARWPCVKPYIPSRRLKAWARHRMYPYGIAICLAGLILIPTFFAP